MCDKIHKRIVDSNYRINIPKEIREKYFGKALIMPWCMETNLHLFERDELWENFNSRIDMRNKLVKLYLNQFLERSASIKVQASGKIAIKKEILKRVGIQREAIIIDKKNTSSLL